MVAFALTVYILYVMSVVGGRSSLPPVLQTICTAVVGILHGVTLYFQFQYVNPVSALVCCADWFKWRLHGEKSESTGGARAPRRRYTVHHPCRCCQKELRQLPRGSSIRFCLVYGQWKEHSAVGVTCDGLGILE